MSRFPLPIILIRLLAANAVAAAPPLDVEPDQVHAGLIAEYRSSVDPSAVLRRVEGKPAFAIDGSSPHPRLPPGRFKVTWVGALQLREAGAIAFSARLRGKVILEVDG